MITSFGFVIPLNIYETALAISGPQVSSAGAAVEITDDVLDAIASVRNDELATRWMVAEYQ